MARDSFGNIVTADDPEAIAAINDFAAGLVAYEARALAPLKLSGVAAAPVLVQVYSGFLHLLAEATGAEENARPYLAAARAAAAGATERERLLVDVLDAWVALDIDRVIALLTTIVEQHPSDLCSLKLLHYHLFNRGEFPAMLRAARIAERYDADQPYVQGMLAFAYEQLHLLEEAEAAAWRGLKVVPNDPWAQHALAHVMLTQGRIDEGVKALEAWSPKWVGLNSFMVTHLWWHLALFYISLGRFEDVLDIYDRQVWAYDRAYSQDQIGAVSLLARLELAGADVGDRWAELAEYLKARATDVAQPFLSVQYLYGLARAGRPEAETLLAAIADAAENGPGQDRAVWRSAALPLARGLLAHARGEWGTAATHLAEALPRLLRLGGSHAQRDLFEQVLLDANLRSGRLLEAQQMLEGRRKYDPNGVPVNTALARVYEQLGLPEEAAQARNRIRRSA